ncbi:MAG: hypothetical protein WA721_03920 [Candidatus Binataceae bacterium]
MVFPLGSLTVVVARLVELVTVVVLPSQYSIRLVDQMIGIVAGATT